MAKRVFLIVLDSFGVGGAPDAAKFGDEGSNTLAAVLSYSNAAFPNLAKMGLLAIDGEDDPRITSYKKAQESIPSPIGSYARVREISAGKDSTIGHWEIAGIISDKAQPTYPDGFPEEVMKALEEATGKEYLCNKPYSGTDVIRDYGEEHMKTGKPIIYTSADSVLQIAAHEEIIPLNELYDICAKAREVINTVATVKDTASLRVREQPNTDAPTITLIPKGEEVLVTGFADGWVQFELDDEMAYVSSDYVSIEERLDTAVTIKELRYGNGISNTRVDMVEYAKQFVGNRYVWGGSSLTKGTDCSGFTMSIYKKYGVKLPHHAASQAKMGTKVTADTIRPGDLVFYAKGGRVNHVAMYIGNGQVVHASSRKTGIKISTLNYRTVYCMRSYLQ